MPRRRDRESGYRFVKIEEEGGTFVLREPDPEARIASSVEVERLFRKYADIYDPDGKIKSDADLARIAESQREWRAHDNQRMADSIVSWPEAEGEETPIAPENCDLLLTDTRKTLIEELNSMMGFTKEQVDFLGKSASTSEPGKGFLPHLPPGFLSVPGQPMPSNVPGSPSPADGLPPLPGQ